MDPRPSPSASESGASAGDHRQSLRFRGGYALSPVAVPQP
ncbi:hypothetical protein CASFOL_009414 [Castilleja foliolosa]|uniref:Uncharacterized protein n=1 Tax=Castilleja foliolosa TaxID=1961234 RepID=A0ABD3E199_9LAMI